MEARPAILCLHGRFKIWVTFAYPSGGADFADGQHAEANKDMLIFDVGPDKAKVWVEIKDNCGSDNTFALVGQSQAPYLLRINIEDTLTGVVRTYDKAFTGAAVFSARNLLPC